MCQRYRQNFPQGAIPDVWTRGQWSSRVGRHLFCTHTGSRMPYQTYPLWDLLRNMLQANSFREGLPSTGLKKNPEWDFWQNPWTMGHTSSPSSGCYMSSRVLLRVWTAWHGACLQTAFTLSGGAPVRGTEFLQKAELTVEHGSPAGCMLPSCAAWWAGKERSFLPCHRHSWNFCDKRQTHERKASRYI